MAINMNWLIQNLKEDSIIFDIGCADMSDTISYKRTFKKGTVYAFECNDSWKEQNLITSKEYNAT